MDVEIAVVQDAISIVFQHFRKAGQRRVLNRSCQGVPVVQRLLCPSSGTIAPYVFEALFKDHHRTDGFV